MLPQVSGSQEGTGVKILPRKFDNLLGFDPAAVHELEALQVDNLESTGLKMSDAGFIVVPTPDSFPKLRLTRMGGSLQRSSFLVANRCVSHLEQ